MPYNQIRDNRSKLGFREKSNAPKCCHPDCLEEGHYPAPMKRTIPRSLKGKIKNIDHSDESSPEKYWFCLEHVRKYNSNWDFFSGFSPNDIDAFTKDAMLGHRETSAANEKVSSKIEKAYSQAGRMRTGNDDFNWNDFNWNAKNKEPSRKEVQAMKMLEISYPIDAKKIKQQYRKLVKLYHPDTNGSESEDKFKMINEAYNYLKSIYS